LEVFSWGEIRRAPFSQSGIGNLDDFLKSYYGYVVAG
jgi:hypothetical protein